jgi:hypothetical protein
MKIAIALGSVLLALIWTGFIAVCAALADWIAGQGGQLQGGMQTLSQWPMPPWVALWVDPALAETIRASVIWSVEVITALMPWITPMLEWVAPLLWVIWAVGLLALVAIAALGLLIVGRLRRSPRAVRFI